MCAAPDGCNMHMQQIENRFHFSEPLTQLNYTKLGDFYLPPVRIPRMGVPLPPAGLPWGSSQNTPG